MKKTKLTKNMKFGFFRKELVKRYGEKAAEELTARAERHYSDCAALCADATPGERQHLEGTILPTVALYRALLERDPDNALEFVYGTMMKLCRTGGAAMGGLLKLPGMKGLFMALLPKMAVNTFGERCGFRYVNFRADKSMLKMDMTACPYCRYAGVFGCPELVRVFCDSDVATYGGLPGIRFERTKTLGTGGECCDFRFVREK